MSENGQRPRRRCANWSGVTLDADSCYRALCARDRRFDGVFFVGVKTTGIYCRPVCPARTPGRDRCVFFVLAAEAEREGFRACFRCRPERAPGAKREDGAGRAVAAILASVDTSPRLEAVAARLGMTSRHLRRVVHAELGVSPVDLLATRRLALARELLLDTELSITEIVFASGFGSVRRFNAAFVARYGRPPSALRKTESRASGDQGDLVRLSLEYRPPLDFAALLDFLGGRAIRGVELVQDGVYQRAVRAGSKRGLIRVRPLPGRHALELAVSPSLVRTLSPVVARARRLFDLDAQPAVIDAHLSRDRRLAALVRRRPGLRLPGAWDEHELAIRAVLGQQVSVAAARTFAGRLVELFDGWPSAALVARSPERSLTGIGLTTARARTLRALCAALANGDVRLTQGADAEQIRTALTELPGIGPWTADYIAMRALGCPDAFPAGDLGLRKALGGVSERECLALADRWRPWRAYAAMHLWTSH